MEETQFEAELGFLKSLRNSVFNALQNFRENERQFISIAKRLLGEYTREYSRVNDLLGFGFKGLEYVSSPSNENFEERMNSKNY